MKLRYKYAVIDWSRDTWTLEDDVICWLPSKKQAIATHFKLKEMGLSTCWVERMWLA